MATHLFAARHLFEFPARFKAGSKRPARRVAVAQCFLGNLRGLSWLNSIAGITGGKSWKP